MLLKSPRYRERSRRTRESSRELTIFLLVALCPLSVQAQRLLIGPPSLESPPTSEDLNTIAMEPGGEVVAVGDNGTVVVRTEEAAGNPIWTSQDAWASTYFSTDIFTVAPSPVAYPNGAGWLIGGREALIETDFTNDLVVENDPGSGRIFTPVLATSEEIWYGVPDLSSFPSVLHRYDRATQSAPGIAFPGGPVLAICQIPGGNLRYVTTDGDIAEIDDSLQVTVLFDQEDGSPLGLNAASFSRDCGRISAGDAGTPARIYVISVGTGSGLTGGQTWNSAPTTNTGSVVEVDIVDDDLTDSSDETFTLTLQCDDTSGSGSGSVVTVQIDGMGGNIEGVETFIEDDDCPLSLEVLSLVEFRGSPENCGGGCSLPAPGGRHRGVGDENAELRILMTGAGGVVRRFPVVRSLFDDGFESGDTTRWSSVSP